MTRVAVATSSELAAEAAAAVADAGGNAVDCALAASLMTMNTEPGVCALAGSAYVTVWASPGEPVTIDGNAAVPGLDAPPGALGSGADTVTMDYGGGIATLVGCGSVAVPGTLKAVYRAWQLFGKAAWRDLFAPVIAAVGDGFPLSKACHYYLGYSGRPIFGRSDAGFHALHDEAGHLLPAGTAIEVPGLADALTAIAEDGAEVFYAGELGKVITEHVQAGGGVLSRQDLQAYEAVERAALQTAVGPWTLATNPAPAVGGAMLSAMLLACRDMPQQPWDREALARLIDVQRACLDFRRRRFDQNADIAAAADILLEAAAQGTLLSKYASASTVHTSAVDEEGLACAITASAGYGSGEMPPGTGLWLNNCLGELELNRDGLDAGPAGVRLPSNMAPSVARKPGAVLAVGSPGADRITTALQQFLLNHLQMNMSMGDAIAHPRVHVDTSGETPRLMAEPGLDLPPLDLPVQTSSRLGMYFGGVACASFSTNDGFTVAADPRREGSTLLCGG